MPALRAQIPQVPAVVLQHQYIITEPIPELKKLHDERAKAGVLKGGRKEAQLPVLRDLMGSFYLRDRSCQVDSGWDWQAAK